MKQIPLTQGKFALIDDIDYDRVVAAGPWQVTKAGRKGQHLYAVAKSCSLYLHRFIMNATDGEEIDHEDGDGFNCTHSNLRVATRSQNGGNQRIASNNTSGFKGVSWYTPRNKWKASIRVDGTLIYLGLFTDPQEAARAYDAAAIKYFGDFAKTNASLELVS